MTTTNEISVGCRMIFVPSSTKQYRACVVSKTTKATFTVRFDDETVAGPFAKVLSWGPGTQGHELYKCPRYSGKDQRVYIDTPEVRAEMDARRIELLERETALMSSTSRYVTVFFPIVVERPSSKQAERAKQRNEREIEIAKQLAEVKEAMLAHDNLFCLGSHVELMPDGTRFYVVNMPVHLAYVDRKGGWEKLIVVCRDVEDYDWDSPRDKGEERKKIRKVESAYTYTNASSHSFSSVSTSKYDNDESAVWDAIRHQYHSW
jgi:hypothetical protein